MNARRLILVIAAAILIVSLMTSYLGSEETRTTAERIPVASTNPVSTVPDAKPGEVAWASWHQPHSLNSEPESAPVLRDLHAAEARYEDLPDNIRARLERDYTGLDVALPRRNR